jgi:hypothetical protein
VSAADVVGQPRPANSQIPADKVRSVIRALYLAILWRNPDQQSETMASPMSWGAYIGRGQRLVQSDEFLKQVDPNHTPQQIINRMYAVFRGRCAFAGEMKNQMDGLSRAGSRLIVANIITEGRHSNPDQILAGGFSPSSCENN